jgi:hypothetical protein
LKLGAVSKKMAIFLTVPTLERQVFIVQFLVVSPRSDRKLDYFWKSCLQVYLHTDSGTCILPLVICFVYKLAYPVPYSLQRFEVPAMQREVRKSDPDWHFFRRVHQWIEIRSPFI